MIIYDTLLVLQYQVSTTVMDLIVVLCIVSCLYLCLRCCVSVSLPNFRRIKIYINLHSLNSEAHPPPLFRAGFAPPGFFPGIGESSNCHKWNVSSTTDRPASLTAVRASPLELRVFDYQTTTTVRWLIFSTCRQTSLCCKKVCHHPGSNDNFIFIFFHQPVAT